MDNHRESEVVNGGDVPLFFSSHSRDLLRHCAAIVTKGDDGRVIAKGTATFAMLGDRRFVLTAKHVTDVLAPAATLLLPPTESTGEALVGVAKPPLEFNWACAPVWASDALDVAIVEPPPFDPSLVRWFDLAKCHPTATGVRAIWRNYSSDESSLPFALCGYPDFGHLRDEGRRFEILAALPLFAYINEWIAASLPLTTKTSPQIHIEAVAEPRDSSELEALPTIERLMANRLKDPRVGSPFGGYSGGPFVLFDPSGVHLLGTIKEGGWLYEKAKFYATPLEDVLAEAGLTV